MKKIDTGNSPKGKDSVGRVNAATHPPEVAEGIREGRRAGSRPKAVDTARYELQEMMTMEEVVARENLNADYRRVVAKQGSRGVDGRSEEHTSELQSRGHLVCRLLL